jgi:hypothetical protein
MNCSHLSTPCATGSCNASNGECVAVLALSRTPCDDGNACTLGEVCSANGACVAQSTIECGDTDPCTDEACVDGVCVFSHSTGPCDDGDGCTGACIPLQAAM